MPKEYYDDSWTGLLVGRKVVAVVKDALILDDGAQLRFETQSDCCSWSAIDALRTCDNVITSATIEESEADDGSSRERAWVHVVTEAGDLNILETSTEPGSGYYLHGFALSVSHIPIEEAGHYTGYPR